LSHSNNIFSSQPELVTNADKENLLSDKGLMIWMTGYSGSGKTTSNLSGEDIATFLFDDIFQLLAI
jgi:adenylylsulfate kinase-like enzyme